MTGDRRRDFTIFIGNGLGMALEPDYFSLEKAMSEFWTINQNKNFEQFCKRFSIDKNSLPIHEKELKNIHIFFDSLRRIKSMKDIYNTQIDDGLFKFMKSYNKFIRNIVTHFYDYNIKASTNRVIFDHFTNSLKEIIIKASKKKN